VAQLLVYDPQPTFVYAPSATGTQNANVFTTWTALFAAAKLSTGPKLLQLSTQGGFAGPFLVDAGTWDLSDFTIDTTQTVTAAERTLSFPDNAFITGTQTLYVRGNLILQSANTVAPVWVVGAGAGAVLDLYGGTLQTSGAGAKPFLNTQGTGFANVRVLFNASVATGTGPTLQADVASTINMRFVGGVGGGSLSLNASTLTGAGTFNVHLSAEAAWSPTQAGVTGTLNFVWDPIVNFQTIQGNGGTGTHTVTATTPNLLRQKSGKVMVTGSCAGATAAADAITVTLVRDVGGGPVVLATKTVTTTAGQLNYDVAFAQVPDTLPDNLAHTYSIQLAGAQNNTVAANQAICTAVEQ
jgi:hypothetical protein